MDPPVSHPLGGRGGGWGEAGQSAARAGKWSCTPLISSRKIDSRDDDDESLVVT